MSALLRRVANCVVTDALTLQSGMEVCWADVVQSLSLIYARTREHRQLVGNEGRRPTRRRCQGAASTSNGLARTDRGVEPEHRVRGHRERGRLRRTVEPAPERLDAGGAS